MVTTSLLYTVKVYERFVGKLHLGMDSGEGMQWQRCVFWHIVQFDILKEVCYLFLKVPMVSK